MDTPETACESIPYITYESGRHMLNFCFGEVFEGLDELEEMMKDDQDHSISDCGVLID